MKLLKKTLSFITVLLLIFYQVYFPLAVLAQEATPSASEEPTSNLQSTPTPIPTTETSSSASLTPTPEPSPVPVSEWQDVITNHLYVAPQNDKVTVTFNELPENPGKLNIKEVTLTDEQVSQTGALSSIAYDISSDMENGTFEYTLTLPSPKTEGVEVKASEDGQTFVTLGGVTAQTDTLTITGLNHFTVFVVVGTISGSNAIPFEESVNPDVIINEFMFNPSSGNDWVELYNQSQGDLSVNVDLTGWTLVDNTSTMITLSGTLPAGGFLTFDVSNRLNAASPSGDKIELRNAEGEIVDQISYKDSTNINGAQNVGNVDAGQSVGRVADIFGVTTTWDVFLIPTKGSVNNSTVYVKASYSSDTDEYLGTFNRPFTTIQNGIDGVAEDGTVNVAAGDYTETIYIDRSLTITGAGSQSTTIFDSDCNGDPTVSIDANNVTLEKLTINNDGCQGSTVSILNDRSGAIIQNNDITRGYYGVELGSGSFDNQILNNQIFDNDDSGIYNGQSTTGNEAHQNIIQNNGNIGVQNNDSENAFDARKNFWGSESGPEGEGNNGISGNVLFQPWYLIDTLTELDSTDPIITFSMPLPGITLPSSIPVIATTNETAICTYSLDGAEFSAMDTTEATSHIKDLSDLEPGSHSIQLNCIDSSGNSSISSTINWTVIDFNNIESDVIFSSVTDGQAELPDGITTLTLSNTANFDVSEGLYTAVGNNIKIGGVDFDLSDFTSGGITNYDFSVPQNIGGISFEIEKAVALQSGTNGEPILLTNSDLSGVNIFLPDGVSVLAPNGWGGTIQPPKTGSSSGFAPSGFSIGNTVIEVGSSDLVLLFDSPVTVLLTGVTGTVGYKSAGSTSWTQITNTCGGTYNSPASPTFPGECAISNGTDTKIVTYHFTSFAALNTVSSSTSTSSQALSPAGGGGTPPVCNDQKPGSTPTLVSAVAGTSSVTLNWNKALNPVTYYLATYGLTSGTQQYGNPNIGGPDATSYTVSGLSGATTYYFKVRAGNGCAPGDFSNEVSATPGGGFVESPATGFAPGVLGEQTTIEDVSVGEIGQVQGEVTRSAQVSPTPQPQETQTTPFDAKVLLIVAVTLLFGFGIFKLIIK